MSFQESIAVVFVKVNLGSEVFIEMFTEIGVVGSVRGCLNGAERRFGADAQISCLIQ
jgi:hypothetical protein